jgi:hypothetical protein
MGIRNIFKRDETSYSIQVGEGEVTLAGKQEASNLCVASVDTG